ncbi:MAG: DUF4956 domain-containing protein [Flavobacteriales bacterium]|nr:DUF4956 domain-containing protein [Flavobacteriales bacterium]MCB9190140.1 DUF4956 domain-containing protein [Flavobacteriales bacterium]
MEIFGSPLYDQDFLELLFRLIINFIVAFIIIRLIYYPVHNRKDYLFTYFVFNLLIFFVSYLLSGVKLQLGFAFGLFAIFGILRYRTEQLAIKEMTYLFVVIAIAIINALANKKISHAELFFTNFAIIAVTYLLEKQWLLRHETSKTITYEKIDLIKPENQQQLIEDLTTRTGLKINRVQVGRIDFLRDTARVRIFYFEDENAASFEDNGEN